MTVIKKAIVEIELRQKGGAGGGASGSASSVTRATKEMTRATEESTRATQEFGLKSAASFREAGEGALRLTRGLALLSSSGSDDLRKLVQNVAVAQGALDVFAGGTKIVTNLSKVFGGPVAVGIAAVTTALGTGAVAWSRYQRSVEESQRALEDQRKAAEEAEKTLAESWSRQNDREASSRENRRGIASLGERFGGLDATRQAALAEEEGLLSDQLTDLQRDAKRRLRGFFKGKGPGGLQGDIDLPNILAGGSTAQQTNALSIEQEREKILRRQLEIDQQQFAIQKEALSGKHQFALENARTNAIPGLAGFDNLPEQLQGNYERQIKEMATLLDSGNKALIDAIRASNGRSEQLRRELEQGANSR